MKLTRRLILLVGLVCIGLLVQAQDIHYDYDRTTDFTRFNTYQWVELKEGTVSNPFLHRNIMRAVDTELAKKGLQRVEQSGSIYLAYQTALDREKQLNLWGTGGPWRLGGGMAQATTQTVSVGKLVLDMYDPTQKQLVWRGMASKTVDVKVDPEKNYKNLQKAVAKLLKNYPPKAKN